MNEVEAIQAQIGALLRARQYLLNQTPSDMVVLADVTEKIIALNRRQGAILGNPALVSSSKVTELQGAIQGLDDAIEGSKSASNILDNVAKVVGSA